MNTTERYRVPPGTHPDLENVDTRDKGLYPDLTKSTSATEMRRLTRRLTDLQRLLWADGSRSLLVVLQAMDTGGKDGTIRKVLTGVNPQGVDVIGFGVPSERELAHDYLWRVHRSTPADGRIAVFNRSHYEDVLVVRVEGLAPEVTWRRRYRHIREFERLLIDEGTAIRKVMLHISKTEQRERLEARLSDPTKGYKFNPGDLATRAKWDQYMEAYDEAIAETSTDEAPWYVVPADRKWHRNLIVARILVEAIEAMDLSYPEPEVDLGRVVIE